MSQRSYDKRLGAGIVEFNPLPSERGTWIRTEGSLFICCKECGTAICIDKHDVYATGAVAPSVKCHKCGFQDQVTLNNYDFPTLKH